MEIGIYHLSGIGNFAYLACMDTVISIFSALGGVKAIASDIGAPYQTVHSWKANGAIPRWRRPALLEMARRKGKALSAEAVSYLASPFVEA